MKVALENIRLDGNTQSRDKISEDTVAEYTEALLNGDQMPPIKVFFDGKDHWVADGHHRVLAHKRAKLEGIDCDITKGTKRDAQVWSFGANHTHGLKRSNETKKLIVTRILEDFEWSEWSDRTIAEVAKVSHPFVARVRKELKDGKAPAPKKKAPPVEILPTQEEEERHDEAATNAILLADELQETRDRLAIVAMDATPEEKELAANELAECREIIKQQELEIKSLKVARDLAMVKMAEMQKQISYWRKKYETK